MIIFLQYISPYVFIGWNLVSYSRLQAIQPVKYKIPFFGNPTGNKFGGLKDLLESFVYERKPAEASINTNLKTT